MTIDKFKSGFLGSPSILVSTANVELVEDGVNFKEFSFFNYQSCTIQINDSSPIYLAAEQGFSYASLHNGKLLYSFIINNADVSYNWIGAIKYVTIRR
ncbi:gp368 [Bacillus phage G]|uniref:Gp368 n=1 Tax=Bacillus phage G TaxID=2884420 RepID=G3MAA9_9CAUD|nr:gp368 [Bacillus phage G]AEO93627.1 gp368 [Bacillus phage G]